MSRSLKIRALFTFVLAILFYLFFQITKHQPALAQVNVFAEDPYDSVDSFGVQFAVFTALLSLVRAFRPYQSAQTLDYQKVLLLRGAYFACLSVAVTLVADTIAMLRHSAEWMGQSAGYTLLILLGAMALFTALVMWLLSRVARKVLPPFQPAAWVKILTIYSMCILILVFYPEELRQSVLGEILTISTGVLVLFAPIWVYRITLSQTIQPPFEDCLDDLSAIYRWLKAHTNFLGFIYNFLEKIAGTTLVRSIISWLNPRKHAWNLIISLGIFMGIFLVLAEMINEGTSSHLNQVVIIIAIFIFFESAGVLLTYGLLAKPLGLFRQSTFA